MADNAGREAKEAVRSVTRRLHDELGLTVRDAGAILGVSYQRAQQLLQDRPKRTTRGVRPDRPRTRAS